MAQMKTVSARSTIRGLLALRLSRTERGFCIVVLLAHLTTMPDADVS